MALRTYAGKTIPKYKILLNTKLSVRGSYVNFPIENISQYQRIDIALGASDNESGSVSIFPNSAQLAQRFLYTSTIDLGFSLIMIVNVDVTNNQLQFKRNQIKGWPDDVGGVFHIIGYYK